MIAHVRLNHALTGILLSVFVLSFLAFGQNISSSVSALIVDPSGAPVAGADCVLIDQATGSAFRAMSDPEGALTFPSVLAGTYRLKIQVNGFKTLEIQSIGVTSSEIRTLWHNSDGTRRGHRKRDGAVGERGKSRAH